MLRKPGTPQSTRPPLGVKSLPRREGFGEAEGEGPAASQSEAPLVAVLSPS
jgi:hypothetical protein